jgi:hypothetical protein
MFAIANSSCPATRFMVHASDGHDEYHLKQIRKNMRIPDKRFARL